MRALIISNPKSGTSETMLGEVIGTIESLYEEIIIKKTSEIGDALNQLAGKITDEQMSELNRRVAYGNERAYDVAKDFLEQEGLL
ncbi:glycine betaine ABC transporter substrate-binding protein [Exiguobacterium sp. BG5(2022)]|uniref:glycine betaine ABC transporter substrate-binding protein n=1 Tax=Exiguobacterium sp. BG5(2022) TaxID=2962595 RepID=UPI002880C3A9|nr:glycine betaine ABC transporter substrate-binding protein [Exiguobacterium sp. BG5(2022)]MDT0191410.1 glycine betaine ABC transporter substrate-binding protein [Exiguobacterium sp. BG5(2022)]